MMNIFNVRKAKKHFFPPEKYKIAAVFRFVLTPGQNVKEVGVKHRLPRYFPPLQSYSNLSCDDGLHVVAISSCENNNNNDRCCWSPINRKIR